MKGWVADTVYFGGGTPSYYGEKRLREILSLIQRLFTVSRPGGDHRGVQPRQRGLALHGPGLRRSGVNRISLGCSPRTPASFGASTASTPPSRWSRRWRTSGRPKSTT